VIGEKSKVLRNVNHGSAAVNRIAVEKFESVSRRVRPQPGAVVNEKRFSRVHYPYV